MATLKQLPDPPVLQNIADKDGKTDRSWQSWFFRLRALIQSLPLIPSPSAGNQVLGSDASGTNLEWKTLTDGNGIDITFPIPGNITITVNQMELANLLYASLLY